MYELWGEKVDIQIPEDVFPDQKWREEKDDLFAHPKHGWFESTFESKKLHYRCNLPKGKPRAVLIWHHGILGQSGFGMKLTEGRFTDFALKVRMMNEAGIAVYAFDALGHGFSEGERFYIPRGKWTINRDDYVKFARFVASQHYGIPLFLSGDSYGGCLTVHAAKVLQDDPGEVILGGMCLNCPAIHGELPPAPVTFILQYGFAPFFPRWTPFFMPHPITAERVWKLEEPRAYFTDTTEMHGLSQGGVPFCLGTALGLLLALRTVQKIIPDLTVPFHSNHGTEDHGVPVSGSEFLVAESKTPKDCQHFNKIEGGYHGLMSEPDAAKYVASEISFIEKMLSK